MNPLYLSLIIPAYNEEKIIKSTLGKVINFLSKKKYSWEILVVDDGSIDKTASEVSGFENKKIRRISLNTNRGKGAALREGVKSARGEFIVFSDADLSVDIKYLNRILEKLEKGSQVVIGSRRVEGSLIAKHQPWVRETMGRIYTLLTKFVTKTNISDYTCGFKGFEAGAAKRIFKLSKIDRWAYDSEILFLANQLGYRIEQIPVTWTNRSDSRVRLSAVILESLFDLMSIRINYFTGKYKL